MWVARAGFSNAVAKFQKSSLLAEDQTQME